MYLVHQRVAGEWRFCVAVADREQAHHIAADLQAMYGQPTRVEELELELAERWPAEYGGEGGEA